MSSRNDLNSWTGGWGRPSTKISIKDADGNIVDLSPMVNDIQEIKQYLKALVFLIGQSQDNILSEEDINNL